MNRFFVKPEQISGNTAEIIGEDVKHIAKVLRLSSGDEVTLCDGAGTEYAATIAKVEKERVLLANLLPAACESEPACRVTLFQGLPKAGKMELLIQKCVELGVYSVVPVAAARSVVQLSAQEFSKKQARYQRVAMEAAKQARRGVIPQIEGLTAFAQADFTPYDLVLIAYEEERARALKAALRANPRAKSIALIVGPEGGLEEAEVRLLLEKGGESVTLGKRILRTETAGMAALAMILYELEGNA